MIVRPPRRSPWRSLVAVLAGLLLLTACGGAPAGTPAPAAGHVVTHAYGTTTVPADPRRVVTLGWTDVENALALGVTPVGFRDWFGRGLNPWAAAAVTGPPPRKVNVEDGFDVEAILALNPDLILANDGLTRAQYDRLAAIAPTVGPIEAGDPQSGSYGVPWDTAVLRTGEILGRGPRAEEVADGVRAKIAAVRAAHPEYTGTTAAMGFAPADGAEPGIATSQDPRFHPLLDIGFVPSPAVRTFDGQGKDGLVEFSRERLDNFEADLLFLYAYNEQDRPQAMAVSGFAALDVVREDRVIWMPDDVADALTFSTAMSIDHVLDALPPLIAQKLRR